MPRKENLGTAKLDRMNPSMILKRFGNLAGLYKSKRGTEYFGWHIEMPGGSIGNPFKWRIVPISTLRLSVLRQCTVYATEAAERGALTQEELESALDYLFAELNKRVNKI